MRKFTKLAIAAASASALAFTGLAPVLADSPGQLETGAFVYEVKDLTKSGTYANTATASACDELQYRVWLHNTEFGNLKDVTVNVSLSGASATSNTSNMTATTAAGGTTGTSGSATVNFSSAQSLNYENGSAVLYDHTGGVINSVSDNIIGNGADLGTLNGSTTEYITFKAKVSCPKTPPKTPPTTPSTPAPKALPNTGPGDMAELFVGSGVLGGFGHYFISRRRK